MSRPLPQPKKRIFFEIGNRFDNNQMFIAERIRRLGSPKLSEAPPLTRPLPQPKSKRFFEIGNRFDNNPMFVSKRTRRLGSHCLAEKFTLISSKRGTVRLIA